MITSELIERIKNNTSANPLDYDDSKGQKLTKPVYYRGRQWAVTGYGIECLDGKYQIDADRLWEEEGEYGWVLHLAEKEWVDIEDFMICLCLARVEHKDSFKKVIKSSELDWT